MKISAAIEATYTGTCELSGEAIAVGDRIRRLNGMYCHSRFSNLNNVRSWARRQRNAAIEIMTPVVNEAITLGICRVNHIERQSAKMDEQIDRMISALEEGILPSVAGQNVRFWARYAEETVRDLNKTIARKQREKESA